MSKPPLPSKLPSVIRPQMANLRTTPGQSKAYWNLCGRSKKKPSFNQRIDEAIELCSSMVCAMDRGELLRVTWPWGWQDLNPHPVKVEDVGVTDSYVRPSLSASQVGQLLEIAPVFNLTRLDDMLHTAWDNYLCVGLLLWPKPPKPPGTLLHVNGGQCTAITLATL